MHYKLSGNYKTCSIIHHVRISTATVRPGLIRGGPQHINLLHPIVRPQTPGTATQAQTLRAQKLSLTVSLSQSLPLCLSLCLSHTLSHPFYLSLFFLSLFPLSLPLSLSLSLSLSFSLSFTQFLFDMLHPIVRLPHRLRHYVYRN